MGGRGGLLQAALQVSICLIQGMLHPCLAPVRLWAALVVAVALPVTISLFFFFGLSWGGCTHGIWRSPG